MHKEEAVKRPYMEPDKEYNEINGYVVFWGLFYAVLFSLAVGYLCLKLGQTVDAFAPISILSMSMAVVLKRVDPFPETVHIQAIGSSGTNILAGAMFILPALYILNLNSLSAAMMAVPVILGGVMGVFIAAIFRRYFCVEMDSVYPFPSGRGAAGVLTSTGGDQARYMMLSGLVGLVFDFVINSLGLWSERLATTAFSWGQAIQAKCRFYLALDNDLALLGLGYFTGIRYGAILAAGSFFASFVCIPLMYYFGGEHTMQVAGSTILLSAAPQGAVFSQFVRPISIGMLAMAGIIGLLSMSGVLTGILKRTMQDLFSKENRVQEPARSNRDIPVTVSVCCMTLCVVIFGVYFHIFFMDTVLQTVIVILLTGILSFLLSIVGISSIAYTGNEPVSGLTLFTMLVVGVVLNQIGVIGDAGIVALLILATFIATTLAVAGNFMSELKVAHITGATPAKMELWQIAGVVVTGISSVGVMLLLNSAYGFVGDGALNAPQANAMAAVASSLMGGSSAPWALYTVGAVFAVVLWMVQVPPLAFALGAYLPMDINLPILVGGTIAYFVAKSSKDKEVSQQREALGGTLASGLIAGGAIGSLLSALLRIGGCDFFLSEWNETPEAVILGICIYLILCLMIYKLAIKARK